MNVHGDNCTVSLSPMDYCVQWFNTTCENATLISDRSTYSPDCPTQTMFWRNPYANSTVLFESHLYQTYHLYMTPVRCTKAYHTTEDGKEVYIDWDTSSTDYVCFPANTTNMPTMKFRFDAQQTTCNITMLAVGYIH